MADSTQQHPYGTCERCGADIYVRGGDPGDLHCPTCHEQIRKARAMFRRDVAKAVALRLLYKEHER